mmetsp:Transcript_959/g.2883  ORF Transcript_959/g.2883 Transcript_959/m.2883 type:complete len:301 (+) Transcript_959:958-1860(+)
MVGEGLKVVLSNGPPLAAHVERLLHLDVRGPPLALDDRREGAGRRAQERELGRHREVEQDPGAVRGAVVLVAGPQLDADLPALPRPGDEPRGRDVAVRDLAAAEDAHLAHDDVHGVLPEVVLDHHGQGRRELHAVGIRLLDNLRAQRRLQLVGEDLHEDVGRAREPVALPRRQVAQRDVLDAHGHRAPAHELAEKPLQVSAAEVLAAVAADEAEVPGPLPVARAAALEDAPVVHREPVAPQRAVLRHPVGESFPVPTEQRQQEQDARGEPELAPIMQRVVPPASGLRVVVLDDLCEFRGR